MGRIRPFAEADIPQVAHLHRTAFKLREAAGLESYREYFTRVFVDHAAGEGPLASLVYQEDDGRILGFLGLVPRRVRLDGQRFQALVSSQFVVDPDSPAGLVALRLAKAYLDGPQDLSIADEANEASRRLWEGLGGSTALLFSIYWTRPLRPARLATCYLRKRRGLAPLAAAAAPLARIADSVAARMPGGYFSPSEPATGADDLCGRVVRTHEPELWGEALHVEHDERTFQWLLDRAAGPEAPGRLMKAVLRKGAKVLGWYVCRLDGEAVAEVLQLTATPSSIGDVLDHLFHRAWRQGAAAVSGRLEPRFMQALSDRYCVFHRRGPWVLVNTKRPQILKAFHTGDACFSRLDGEWSLRFRPAAN
jgi:hypothetical protein